MTVAEFVRGRVTQWETAGNITPRNAQRYRQLVENQIVPHIGTKPLQKVSRLDVEAWHAAPCAMAGWRPAQSVMRTAC
jgi:integrase